ncbi:hypothetical protein GCM10010430_25740 [Kitasatospora cystarginea]|uniref:Uncharacterized protein n=1 Tax=Kitasatospora cystarginea TaxID=58350 RepID=A0ABN3DW69_9ACTN
MGPRLNRPANRTAEAVHRSADRGVGTARARAPQSVAVRPYDLTPGEPYGLTPSDRPVGAAHRASGQGAARGPVERSITIGGCPA